LFEQD